MQTELQIMTNVIPKLSNWKDIVYEIATSAPDLRVREIAKDYLELLKEWVIDWEDGRATGSDLEREVEKRKDSILFAYATRSVEAEDEIYRDIEFDFINDLLGMLK